MRWSGKFIDKTGKKFGRLTVISRSPHPSRVKWKCICECGAVREVFSFNLAKKGGTFSCGCMSAEKVKARFTTHGEYQSPEWRTWNHLKDRCLNPDSDNWKYYGGRGISVCDRWKHSFQNFLSDMGKRPTLKHGIERKNNAGNYEPSNCIWATQKEQNRNTRANRTLSLNGHSMILADWSIHLGIPSCTLSNRIRRGLPIDRVLEPRTK